MIFYSIQHIYFLGESNNFLYMVTNEYQISSIYIIIAVSHNSM